MNAVMVTHLSMKAHGVAVPIENGVALCQRARKLTAVHREHYSMDGESSHC